MKTLKTFFVVLDIVFICVWGYFTLAYIFGDFKPTYGTIASAFISTIILWVLFLVRDLADE